jgi:hypothetical protein
MPLFFAYGAGGGVPFQRRQRWRERWREAVVELDMRDEEAREMAEEDVSEGVVGRCVHKEYLGSLPMAAYDFRYEKKGRESRGGGGKGEGQAASAKL